MHKRPGSGLHRDWNGSNQKGDRKDPAVPVEANGDLAEDGGDREETEV